MISMDIESRLEQTLSDVFGQEVRKQWNVTKDTGDDLRRGLHYSPRLDLAVGPFNTDRKIADNNAAIEEVFEDNEALLMLLNPSIKTNRNPRCFLAIEIENRTGTKHRLGSIIYAAALGMIEENCLVIIELG